MPPARPLSDRFWEKVNKTDTCWLWTGSTVKAGRGQIRVGTRNVLASHVAWFLQTGRWPKPPVCHSCDVAACVRFEHLYEGTHKSNTQDAIKRGRRKHWMDGLPMDRETCRLGHQLRLDNLGRRYCRTCNTAAVRRSRERKKK